MRYNCYRPKGCEFLYKMIYKYMSDVLRLLRILQKTVILATFFLDWLPKVVPSEDPPKYCLNKLPS